MVHPIWPNNNEGHEPLPAPNVVVARSGARLEELPPQAIKGILVNTREAMPSTQQPDQHFPVRLTQAQRKVEKEWNRFKDVAED